ncbi:MAG TPA: hypothetical protein VGI92_12390 [Gemmatimonadales bacterium]
MGIVLGLMWDISWHMSVGRDTFWSPPHMLEYVSASVAGILCGTIVLRTTFAGTPEMRAASVGFWGFRGPLGAWITIWGTFAMLSSAPFDNWWHNAYGLDVKIVSPPHAVLFLGMLGIVAGALALTAAAQNRSAGEPDELRDAWLYAITGGVLLFIFGCGTLENSWPNEQHFDLYYRIWAGTFPLMLVGHAKVGRLRYPATASAGVFMLMWFVMGQVLAQVPALARLGPIYNPRTYLWPPYFPVLLIVPALGIDLVSRRLDGWNPWAVSLALGGTFVLLLLAVQWPMSTYLVTGHSHNWLFHGQEYPYSSRPGPWETAFWRTERSPLSHPGFFSVLSGLPLAILVGTVSSRLGLVWGSWVAKVQR